MSLSKSQKALIVNLSRQVQRIEGKGHSNWIDRKAIDNLFTQLSRLLLVDLENFSFAINQLRDEKKINDIREKINAEIKSYFTADTIHDKSEASETLALQMVAITAPEMKRNKLHIVIEDSALNIAKKILEKGDVLCRTL